MARFGRRASTPDGVVLVALAVVIGGCSPAKNGSVAGNEAERDARQTDPKAFYVRPVGGGAEDGSSWANAMHGLPRALKRGAVYWLGGGDYGDYTFDDPSHLDSMITIRKATAESHGSEDGWRAEYGRGQAVFGPLRLTTSHYLLDGGEQNGLRAVGRMGTGAVIQIDGSHVTLRNVEIDGGLRKLDGKQTAGACNGSNVSEDHVVFDRCEIHNIADDGIGIYASHIKVLRSKIHDLDGCGTDGDCGPCYNGHSDGIELSGAVDVELVGNLIYDVRSNAAVFMDDWSGSAVRDLLLFNNVFYVPDSGFALYLQKVDSARVHNNIIWGKTQGSRYGGLAMGREITNLEMFNNIILNINFSHMGAAHDPKQHKLDFNLFGMINSDEYSAKSHDSFGDPRFSRIPMSDEASAHLRTGVMLDDFKPMSKLVIDTGTTPSEVPARDIVGVERPQGNAWDRGPFELSP